MRKGIGPRGLGAPKSPAKMYNSPAKKDGDPKKKPKHDGSMKYQRHLENEIRSGYNQQLRAKKKEIRNRTYKEMGLSNYQGDRKSKEYQSLYERAENRIQNRMMNNKGPKAIRAQREAAIGESRATYDAMPQVQSRRQYQEAKLEWSKRPRGGK